MLDVLTGVMLPVLAVSALGAWVGRVANASVPTLSALVFSLFSPALVLHTLIHLEFDADLLLRVVGVMVIGFAAMAFAGFVVARLLGHDRARVGGTALCAALPNSGNLALPLAALAFGPEGLGIAVVAFVVGVVLTFTGGVVIASLAGGSARGALWAPFKAPSLWVVPPGLALNMMEQPVPAWLGAGAEMLAGATIPVMLVVLGMQCAARLPQASDLRASAGALVLRLFAGPAVAAGATVLLGVGGVAQRTLIVIGGMPTAVMATIIATQYRVEPDLVSRTVIVSTVTSFATLTLLIALLR